MRWSERNSPQRRFVDHNRRLFPVPSDARHRGPVVLFEWNRMRSAHIAYSYLANVLAEKEDARIVAYGPDLLSGWQTKLSFLPITSSKSDVIDVYKSFGTTEFLDVRPTVAQVKVADEIIESFLPGIRNKKDVEDLTIGDVWIGDLVYDTHLKRYKRPTVDIGSEEFLSTLKEFMSLFIFWREYIERNDVRAINVSHCVYDNAIPLRLGVCAGIPAYQINLTHAYRLGAERLFAYNDFFDFRTEFRRLPEPVRAAGLEKAQRQIQRRFSGEVGVDMAYSSKSAYGATRHERLIAESPRKKVLVATHCFFDSPHSYGRNLFPDFYEWLEFLGTMTKCTDYDWYIKTHPDYIPGTMDVIESFIGRYPKFILLPAESSHHQIIEEGINVALTVYGTIAFEYAALGVPVINASLNNPHIAYEFNKHPTSIEEYKEAILNTDNIDLSIDQNHVYEYYFMKNIFNTNNIFFQNHDAVLERVGGFDQQFKSPIYAEWLSEFSQQKHQRIISGLRDFVDSGDFRMGHKHYGEEFSLESMGEGHDRLG